MFFALLSRALAWRLKFGLRKRKPVLLKYTGYSVVPHPRSLDDWVWLTKLQCTSLGITTEMVRDFLSGERRIEEMEQELFDQKRLAKTGQLAPWVRRIWPHVEKKMKQYKLTPEALLQLYEKTEVQVNEHDIYHPEVSPNPVSRETAIRYKVAKAGHVKLFIFADDGKLIKTLTDSTHTVGEFNVKWDETNDHGQPVAPGSYFVQAYTPSYVASTPFKLTA